MVSSYVVPSGRVAFSTFLTKPRQSGNEEKCICIEDIGCFKASLRILLKVVAGNLSHRELGVPARKCLGSAEGAALFCSNGINFTVLWEACLQGLALRAEDFFTLALCLN